LQGDLGTADSNDGVTRAAMFSDLSHVLQRWCLTYPKHHFYRKARLDPASNVLTRDSSWNGVALACLQAWRILFAFYFTWCSFHVPYGCIK